MSKPARRSGRSSKKHYKISHKKTASSKCSEGGEQVEATSTGCQESPRVSIISIFYCYLCLFLCVSMCLWMSIFLNMARRDARARFSMGRFTVSFYFSQSSRTNAQASQSTPQTPPRMREAVRSLLARGRVNRGRPSSRLLQNAIWKAYQFCEMEKHYAAKMGKPLIPFERIS